MEIDVKTCAAFLIATALALPASAEALKIATSADYPPWESVNEANEIIGFDREVGDELCKRLSLECTWVNQAYDGLLPGLQIGRFDAVMSAVSINAERAGQVDFTIAYADAPNRFAMLPGAGITQPTEAAGLKDALDGKIVGVQSGTTHEQVMAAHFPDVTVRIYERPDQIFADMQAQRIDAGLMELSAWEPFTGTDGKALEFLGPQLTAADMAEFGHGQGIALKKGSEDLKTRMDATIQQMLADGTIAAMARKWFGYDVSSKF